MMRSFRDATSAAQNAAANQQQIASAITTNDVAQAQAVQAAQIAAAEAGAPAGLPYVIAPSILSSSGEVVPNTGSTVIYIVGGIAVLGAIYFLFFHKKETKK